MCNYRPRGVHRIVYDWAIRCFGYSHVVDSKVRVLRLVEEAVELAQALEVPEEKMSSLVKIVYSRKRGAVRQELGGVMMTTSVLASAIGLDPDECFEDELIRVLKKNPEHFAKRNAEKVALGLTGEEDV